jgi:hypothetical protein
MLESDELSNPINMNSLSSKESELISIRMLNTNRQNSQNTIKHNKLSPNNNNPD